MNAALAARLPLEMLHSIGNVSLLALNAGLRQCFVEDCTGGPDEWTPGKVFFVARLFSNEQDPRMGSAFVKKFTEERELTVMLVVDVSASGNFGSTAQSKRELAAEVACLLAFSAIRNNDKVGLLLFTDRVELFIPPKKGRSHTLRIIREILFFEPQGRGTEPGLALDYLNKIVTRRAVVFFISDFQAPDFSRALAVSGRRHDFIAIQIQDERERSLPNVGIITLEDAETGEQIEINTADRKTRTVFTDLVTGFETELSRTLRRNNVDTITLQTGRDYLPPLRSFFKQRERRLGVR